jgi:peptide/nickel transport system ATP-binding protein
MTPSLLKLGPGCAFRERCDRAVEACAQMPDLVAYGARRLRCVNPVPAASAVLA